MKNKLPILALVLPMLPVVPAGANEGSNAFTVRLTSEVTYRYQKNRTRFWPGETEFTDKWIHHGSGFFFNPSNDGTSAGENDDVILVTAAHVVTGHGDGTLKFEESGRTLDLDTEPHERTIRIRVGYHSIVPKALNINLEKDVAALWISRNSFPTLKAAVLVPSDKPPSTSLETTCWGFPGTSNVQAVGPVKISDVKSDFFILPRVLEPGFSGGPVLSKENRALGVIARSTSKQSRIVRIENVKKLLSEGEPIEYRDGIAIHTTQTGVRP